MLELKDLESKSLIYIRVFAMTSIIICHLFQAYSNKWASVFNVGVQVFLVLSGYLYGYKAILDWKKWWLRRISKIYVPYLLALSLLFFYFIYFTKSS